MAKKGELTAKQNRFIAEYLKDSNATQAAIRAGYKEKNASVIGYQLLHKTLVIEKLSRKQAKILDKLEISAENVLRELARLGFSDMKLFAEWKGNSVDLKSSNLLSEDESRCVSEISTTNTKEGTNVKIKLHDKKGALDSLAKHLGMFVDRVENGQPGEFKELAKKAYEAVFIDDVTDAEHTAEQTQSEPTELDPV